MSKKADMQRLIEQRDRLLVEMEALKNKVAGLEMAISLLDGEEPGQREATAPAAARSSVKGAILDLLREVGTTGLNAATAVEIASRRGIALDKQTVSSLLSRLKRDGVVVYENDRYRLAQFANTKAGDGDPSTLLRVIHS